jgi:hypothetical protein
MNDFLTVLHCHHYLCLTTQTALQFKKLGGVEILMKTAADTIYPVLRDYIDKNQIYLPEDRLAVGAAYYAVMGLGKMEAQLTAGGGEVKLFRSHIDQGWLSKWGRADMNLNYFTCGYISAMYSAATDSPLHSIKVREISSIVSGEKYSFFRVEKPMG